MASLLGRRLVGLPWAAPRTLGVGFLVLAAAAVLGGTVHGFGPRLTVPTKAVLWALIYGGVGLAALLFLGGLALAVLPGRSRALVPLVLGLRVTVHALGFPVGPFDFAAVFLGLLLCSFDLWLRRRDPGGPWLLAGVLVAVTGAAAQVGRVVLGPALDHNDLFHLLGGIALWFFYRGGRGLRERV